MLVLSRKLGESIVIGDNIKITVVSMDYGKIRLGIEAPRSVPVFRSELWRGSEEATREALEAKGGKATTCSICNDPKCDNPNGKH